MESKKSRQSTRTIRKNAELSRMFIKEEVRARCKKITEILKKPEEDRTVEDRRLLELSPDVAKDILKRSKSRELARERKLEVEDERSIVIQKAIALADAIKKSKSLVIYTGAGISTAASIPDYRGPNGVWTLLQQGKQIKAQDLSDAEPTFTHMAIAQLFHQKKLRHVVSQNCDGLHVRSGLPCYILSEVHGNMYLEICTECNPQREYMRLFDVTEKTSVRRHKTGRHCHRCKAHLRDTIVHFGEKSPNKDSPYNWEEAADAAEDADLVLCLGTSLKILKKYSCLWHTHLPPSQRPDLYIVNLMWTPKDDAATLKINGRCDDVMKIVMHKLGFIVPKYDKFDDPIFRLATALKPDEVKSTTKKILIKPESRASDTAHYYEDGKEMDAELKNFEIKDKADSKKRTRTKTEFYDPGIPSRTTVKRVRTKAELKQEPSGQQPSDHNISGGAIELESLQVEPFLSSNTNSLINQSGINLPCLSADPTFNPMAQISMSSVPWMVPNVGLMSNSLPNPMMMYPGMLPPGVGSSFMPTPNGNFLHSGTSEYLNERMQSSTGARIRRNKKRRNRKVNTVHSAPNTGSTSVRKTATSEGDRLGPSAESEMILNAVALEHSYTMPPDAINSKQKSLKSHTDVSTCSPQQDAKHSGLKVDSNSPQKIPPSASIPTEDNRSSKRLNKRCSTIKQLLEKPTMINKTDSKSPIISNTASGSEATAVKPTNNEQSSIKDLQTSSNQQQVVFSHQTAVSKRKSDTQESRVLPFKVNDAASVVDTPVTSSGSRLGSCLDNKAKLSSMPSISHAIEMVKLQQQGALSKDCTNTIQNKRPATKTVEEYTQTPNPVPREIAQNGGTLASKTENKKSEPSPILSQLSSPPIAPVIDVKLQKRVQGFDVCNNASKLSTTTAPANPGVSSVSQLSCLSDTANTNPIITVASQMSTMHSVTAHTPLQTSSQMARPRSTNSAVQSRLPSKKGYFQATGKRDLTPDANKQQDPPPVDNNLGQITQQHSVEHSEPSSRTNLKDEFILASCNEPKKLELVAPVITTQTLQEALTQLSSVSSIAIPPKVADLVLHCPKNTSKSSKSYLETEGNLENNTENRSSENSSSGVRQRSHSDTSQNRSEIAETSVSTQNTTLEKTLCVKHETLTVTTELASPAIKATFTQNGNETILPVKKALPSTYSNQAKNQCVNETSSQTTDSLKQCEPHLQEEMPTPECSDVPRQNDHGLSGPENTLVAESSLAASAAVSATTSKLQPQGNDGGTVPGAFLTTQALVADASIPQHESPPVAASKPLTTARAAAPLRPPPPLLHISQLQTSPVKIPQLASPESGSQFLTEGPPAFQIPNASDPVVQAENLFSPQQNGNLQFKSDQTDNSPVSQVPCQLSALAPNLFTTQNIPFLNEHNLASYDVLSPAGVFANPQLSQSFFDGMNQAFNAQMLSQMALSQFGGFQQQAPSALPLFNMIMQDTLQGNFPAIPQLQHAQMLGLTVPTFGTPGLPIGDPTLLGSFHHAGGMPNPLALSGQLATNVVTHAIQNTTSSVPQDICETVESGCSKGKKNTKESRSCPIDIEQYLPKHEDTENSCMASKTSDPTETVATAPNAIQLDQSSHLNCSTNQSEDSGTHSLPGSKINELSDVTEVSSKDIGRKDRSESQDSNSTLSDGESPVSTPTTTSVPGWFGKGLNLKKGRRKRSK